MNAYERNYFLLDRFLKGSVIKPTELRKILIELLGHEAGELIEDPKQVSITDVRTDLLYFIDFIRKKGVNRHPIQTDYQIVRTTTETLFDPFQALMQEVKVLQKEGWECVGGISVVSLLSGHREYYQTMVNKEL